MQQQVTQWIQLPDDQTTTEYLQQPKIQEAAQLLQRGELVAFPTETVYGLGADATNEQAVAGIFTAKGRPSDNPLIVHIAKPDQLASYVTNVTPLAQQLVDAFWPGPLTLILPHNGTLAPQVTAGLSTVAIRLPSHPVARALIQLADRPIAAPSANRSGRPSPTVALHVWHDLQRRIPMLLDAGAAEVGLESTVIDITDDQPVLLRPGGITLEALSAQVGPVRVDPGLATEDQAPRSPGMKYQHYAPDAPLWLVSGDLVQMRQQIQHAVDQARARGQKVGVLTTSEQQHGYIADLVLACGTRADSSSVARELYQTLHQFNAANLDLILAESFPEQGAFYSVMNRLNKAAGGRWIRS